MQISTEQRRQAFSVWLRTGRWPRPVDRREFKFNPWHDLRDGRFTFAGAGSYYGTGGTGPSNNRGQNTPQIVFKDDPAKPRLTSREEVDAWAAGLLREHGNERGFPEAIEAQRQRYMHALARSEAALPPPPPRDAIGKAADFATGLGEGVFDVGKDAAAGLYALATTNPATTAKNTGLGIARAIDGALEAEDTPAYVQAQRAARAIANASAHDLGHALGTATGNIALGMAPGAVVSKISTASRAGGAGAIFGTRTYRAARVKLGPGRKAASKNLSGLPTSARSQANEIRPASARSTSKKALTSAQRATTFSTVPLAERVGNAKAIIATKGPPQVTWVNESQGFHGVAKDYNDSAMGAHSDPSTRQARVPAIERTLPDGSRRKVRFDGLDGEFLTDRKWSIYTTKKAKDQALRQSEALKQNGLIGIWEVPNEIQKRRALKMFDKLGITNIQVEVVKP